jgi:peptide/nickel transport system permease protein
MVKFLIKRLGIMVITLFVISIISFIVIDLPPGDYVTSYIMSLRQQGTSIAAGEEAILRERYGLDRPLPYRYYKWISNFVRGDLGRSYQYNRDVIDLLAERMPLTIAISVMSLLFTWIVSFVVGIWSALRKYSFGDYVISLISFLSMSVPSFVLALALMYVGFAILKVDVGGLFSPQYVNAPWSVGRFIDLLQHLWIPVIVIGLAGTAGTIRVLRATLIDELEKPYVIAAKAKGLPMWKVILKYPVRIALNPFISTVGWTLPALISGGEIVAIVLNLPTTGPLLLAAIQMQDMYMAGSFIMVLSTLTVIGTLLSDILLAMSDPRIRLG